MAVSAYVIASMCGCWNQESGVNPGIWESLTPCAWDYQYEYTAKGGYGLGQWTNVGTPHGRLYNLHTYVTSQGYSDGDGIGQLKFVEYENHWANSSQSRLGYNNLSEFLASDSTNLNDLVWDFLANWEGVPGNKYTERCDSAQRFYNYILEHKDDDPSGYTFRSYNNWTSDADKLNNVMCVYFYYEGYVPPTPESNLLYVSYYLRERKRRLK